MNIEDVRKYCIKLKGITEEQPFGPEVVVYKVMGKIYALLSLGDERRVSLKNTPARNLELRAKYHFITGAWHMNKEHWSMIQLDDVHDKRVISELIDESYNLVVKKLTKKLKIKLSEL